MKLLVIADRAPQEDSKTVAESSNVDLIVTLGDLDIVSLARLKDITDIPKIGIYGNHCSGSYFESLGIQDMHMVTREFKLSEAATPGQSPGEYLDLMVSLLAGFKVRLGISKTHTQSYTHRTKHQQCSTAFSM